MLEAGVDIIELQKILGHVSILTTVKYTHLTTVTQQGAVTQVNHLMDGINIQWGAVK
ncbi:MAG: tyrosine-type recombinase/integrase [Colwellia sp.]